MPQEHHILKCYACDMYQVHFVKKAKKWQCKTCNKKQSIQRVYFQGSGRDCRINVQKLSMTRANGVQFISAQSTLNNDNKPNNDTGENTHDQYTNLKASGSRWSKYLDKSEPKDYYNTNQILECQQPKDIEDSEQQHLSQDVKENTWSRYVQRPDKKSTNTNDIHNDECSKSIQSNLCEMDEEQCTNSYTSENIWSGLLEESDTDDNDIETSDSALNTPHNEDREKPEEDKVNTKTNLHNRNNFPNNDQSNIQNEVNAQWNSIFESNDDFDDISLDF